MPSEIPEKRRHVRFRSFNVIQAVGLDGREIHDESALVNLSEGGLLFYSNENVEENTLLDIRIEIPEFNSSIEVSARVMWVQRAMQRPHSYFVGVKFSDLQDSERHLIRRLHDQTQSRSV